MISKGTINKLKRHGIWSYVQWNGNCAKHMANKYFGENGYSFILLKKCSANTWDGSCILIV